MEGIFVGRQPIYDRSNHIFAYELLYRRSSKNVAEFSDANQATMQVIINTFMEIGLENIVGSRPAFINITRDFFAGHHPLPMSHEQVIFEVLENIVPESRLIDGMRELKEQGYLLALDDFIYRPEYEPLLKLASFVKIDILDHSDDELTQSVAQMQGRGLKLIAEKVETPAQHALCEKLGFDYFQGYFFSHPDVIQGRTAATNRTVIVNLIARLQNPAVEMRELEKLIAQDAILSYRLLRYINCATFALRREIDSIHQAVMLLGTSTIRNWATLLLASQAGNSKPQALLVMALIRARMCELMAVAMSEVDCDQAFTVGLFSLLDVLLDVPMEELLDHMPLSMPLKLALLDRQGPLGGLLQAVIHYERGEWDHIERCQSLSVDCNNAYLSALRWADESAKQLLSS